MKRRMFLKMSAMLGLMAAPVIRLFEKKREYVTKCKIDEVVGLRCEGNQDWKSGCVCECDCNLDGVEMEVVEHLESFYFRGQFIQNNWRNKYLLRPVGKNKPEIVLVFQPPLDSDGNHDYGFYDLSKGKFYRV